MAENTPMMKQYQEIKEQNKDAILFFRLGDFYEMFNEDALTASRELDLTLTTRDRGRPEEERTPMCGVPYHSSDAYIARLIAKGYKVAICEQMEDPATAKGLVKRDIIRVVTPGTVTDSASLEEGRSNYIAGIYLDQTAAGVCFCDITTGQTQAAAFSGNGRIDHLINEVGRFAPVEAVVNELAAADAVLSQLLRERLNCRMEILPQAACRLEGARKTVERQFGEDVRRLPPDNPGPMLALGGLLGYLHDTQKTDLSYIRELEVSNLGRALELDLTARRNLELTETIRSKEKKGSLLWVLDKTKTAMGGRLLRSWLEQPLMDVAEIRRRSGAVEELVNNTVGREELILALTGVSDLERLIGRVVYGSAGGRDLVSLGSALGQLPQVKEILCRFGGLLAELNQGMDPVEDVVDLVGQAIVDEPPFSVREGGFIREGYDPQVDELRSIQNGGTSVIAQVEAREKERTGIRTLKVGYNKVFGYYIEVSKSFYDQVPDDYIRKQTLANCERYITQELKDLEHTVLTAKDRLVALEYQTFRQVCDRIADQTHRIQAAARAVAQVDCLASLAAVAAKEHYCRPEVDNSDVIEITDGRHPVVEKMLKGTLFVPNDTRMGTEEGRVAIITGPNMAGKSTYMRQVALITLMAQVGSFVPARSAHIGVVDRIFTRIGASDDLSSGQSTFMVEMNEVSEILRCATRRSLLILDEIGRGTSTFDGMSIARAVVEHCAGKIGAKTLFATHYHELTALEGTLRGVANFNIAIKARGEDIIFLRKILPGGADRSYGIEVAKLAGLPDSVVRRSRAILAELESGGHPQSAAPAPIPADQEQVSMGDLAALEVAERLRRCQPDTMTPIEAMSLLYELKQKLL